MASSPKNLARVLALVAGVIALIVAAIFLTHRAAPPKATSAAIAAAYADPATCASCHADIAATYAKTGMGRSFANATASNVVENYTHGNTLHHAASGLDYTLIERDGQLFERRAQTGPDGQEINGMEERIDYIIGSGNHSRSYLHRNPDGQLIELPVSWYSERGGYWAMSPGFDNAFNKDFRRAITPECMFCHNGYPGSAGTDESRSRFPANLPQGIDCQRCHGPGQAHVDAARASTPKPELIRATIVNPARLSRERQLEVCYQCHLETSHHEPNEQRLFDRTAFSYRPGERIADYKLYLDPTPPGDDTFEIAHAAYRLRRSACFRNSQMTCLTCHDPHEISHGKEATDHYLEVCLNCHRNVTHTVALPAESNCLTCHMPKRRAADAVHVVMTDHWIRRTQPAGNLLAPISETLTPAGAFNHGALYYPAKLPDTPQAQIAMAQANVNDHGTAALESLLEKYHPNAPEPYLALARAYEKEGNQAEVAQWSQQALSVQPNYRPAIVEAVPALFATSHDGAATTLLEQAVAATPDDDLLLSDLGQAYLRQGEFSRAGDTLRRAIQLNPDRPESHNLLGAVALKLGGTATADHEFREALRCQPDLAEANDNLASLLAEQGSYRDAAFYFEKSLAADPTNARAHDHYGRMLVLSNQLARAQAEFSKAAAIDPQDRQIQEDRSALQRVMGVRSN